MALVGTEDARKELAEDDRHEDRSPGAEKDQRVKRIVASAGFGIGRTVRAQPLSAHSTHWAKSPFSFD